MSKLMSAHKKVLGTVVLILTITLGTYFLTSNNDYVGAFKKETVLDVNIQPVHSMNYKLGNEEDVKNTIRAHEIAYKRESHFIQKEITAQKEAERKEQEEKERNERIKAEKRVQQEKVEIATNNEKVEEIQNLQQADSSTQAITSSNVQNSPSSADTAEKSKQTQTKVQSETPSQTQTSEPTIGPDKIGINGIYRNYSNYGMATTDQYQAGIDSGLIVAGITNFNGSDGQTTYFGGHNPGIMNFIANNIYNGAIVTITDSNGQAFQYKMIDKVDVDEYGEGMLQSIGMSAIDAYAYGTGTESILIHFCNTSNNLMSFWYGVQI